MGVSLLGADSDLVELNYSIDNDNSPYAKWSVNSEAHGELSYKVEELLSQLKDFSEGDNVSEEDLRSILRLLRRVRHVIAGHDPKGDESLTVQAGEGRLEFADARINSLVSRFSDFIIYSPENSMLRTLEREGQVLPLGINGEGLLRFLQVISSDAEGRSYEYVKEALSLFSWYEDFDVSRGDSDKWVYAKDKFLWEGRNWIDQRSTNEGFLFAAFYFSLFSSERTPPFFAIDNVDASLNPKLCVEVMKRISFISKEMNKQCILTTHNPAILDGLDLTDPEHKLFVVSRNRTGGTVVRSFDKKPDISKKKMSELFLAGSLGGLPKGF